MGQHPTIYQVDVTGEKVGVTLGLHTCSWCMPGERGGQPGTGNEGVPGRVRMRCQIRPADGFGGCRIKEHLTEFGQTSL